MAIVSEHSEYRVVAVVRDVGQVAGRWSESRDDAARDLTTIQDGQASGDAIRLPWLGITDGRTVLVVTIEERTIHDLSGMITESSPMFRRDMQF